MMKIYLICEKVEDSLMWWNFPKRDATLPKKEKKKEKEENPHETSHLFPINDGNSAWNERLVVQRFLLLLHLNGTRPSSSLPKTSRKDNTFSVSI